MNQIFGDFNSQNQGNNNMQNPPEMGYNTYEGDPNYNNYNEYNGYNNYSNFSDLNLNINNYEAEDPERVKMKKIVRLFCILSIVFGVIIAGKSTYALTLGKPKPKDVIQVSTDKMGKEVTITIESGLPIEEYAYRWNDGEETRKDGDGTISISETIDIPNGNNILKLEVIDNYGNKTEYQKQYIYESNDIQKPSIKFEIVGKKLKITATDDQEMQYMTYQWNDEEATRVDVDENNKLEITEEIDVSSGKEKLTIVAVDAEDNKETVTKTIIGLKKPTFTLETEGRNLVIKAEDEEGIKSISVTVDGTETVADDINEKEIEAKLPLEEGNHQISVTVTNINDQDLTKELIATI